jgi:hypothetical protein
MRSNNAVVVEQRMCQKRSYSVMLAAVSYVTVLQKIVRLAFDQECKSFVQVENRLLPKIVRHIKN